MCRLVNLRPAIGIPASTGKHHALVMKADIIDQPKPIVGYRLLKRPKKVIRISSGFWLSALKYSTDPDLHGL